MPPKRIVVLQSIRPYPTDRMTTTTNTFTFTFAVPMKDLSLLTGRTPEWLLKNQNGISEYFAGYFLDGEMKHIEDDRASAPREGRAAMLIQAVEEIEGQTNYDEHNICKECREDGEVVTTFGNYGEDNIPLCQECKDAGNYRSDGTQRKDGDPDSDDE
jgi:hypothetical protein